MARVTKEQLLDILQTSESEEMLLDMADFDRETGGDGKEFLDLYKQANSVRDKSLNGAKGARNGEEKGNRDKI